MVIPRTVVLFQQIGYTNERIESARLGSEKRSDFALAKAACHAVVLTKADDFKGRTVIR